MPSLGWLTLEKHNPALRGLLCQIQKYILLYGKQYRANGRWASKTGSLGNPPLGKGAQHSVILSQSQRPSTDHKNFIQIRPQFF